MRRFIKVLIIGAMAMLLVACGDKTEESKGQELSVSPTPTTTVEPSVSATPTPIKEDDAVKESLKDIYSKHGLKVGTCLSTTMINNPKIEKLLLSQFNSVTMENDMKPDYILDKNASIESGEIVVKFNANMLKMLEWAKDNNMAVRGHTLVWYSQTPEWIFHEDFDTNKPFSDRETMLNRMESYIKQVFEKLDEAGYIDLFYAYDVVNEAWMEDGKLREEKTYWKQTIGDDYIWYAFFYADKYAPDSIDLYYNDYNEQYKTGALVKFVDTLKDEDGRFLIDGIGLQAHLYTEDNLGTYFKTLDSLAATGLKLQITELDVSLGSWQKELKADEKTLKEQGEYYNNLLTGFIDRVDKGVIKSDALTFWGFIDSLSWRKSASPLLFNEDLSPKPAFYGACMTEEK